MKKSYFLDEEEKNRILSIHESAAKKQYLNEQGFGGDNSTPLTKAYSEMVAGFSGPGTDPDRIINALNTLTTAKDFWAVNQMFATKKPGGIVSFQNMINDEFGYASSGGNQDDIIKIIAKLKSIGISSKIGKSPQGTWMKDGSFEIFSQPVTQQPTTPKRPVTQQQATPKQGAVKQQPTVQQRRQQITQQTQRTTKEIQKLLGQTQTGNIDSLNVEKMIDLLKQ